MLESKTDRGFLRVQRSRRIGPVAVQVARRAEALSRIREAVERSLPSVWGFCNAHTVNMARRDPAFRAALGNITLFNDGIGVDLASRVLHGSPFPENLNGTDLTPALLSSLNEGVRVFLVGSPPGTADQAAEALARMHPNIRIAGTSHGYFTPADEPAIVAQIEASNPGLVLVGMGHPTQELWAIRHMHAIGAPLVCVGAFLDFAAGRISRAPEFLRRLRLEWLYRLAQEPRRMASRYLVGNVTFCLAILKDRLWGDRQ